MAVLGGGFLEHNLLEIGRTRPSLGGEEASATSELGPANGGRRGGPTLGWCGAATLVRGGGAGGERRRRQPNSDGGQDGGRAKALEVRGVCNSPTRKVGGAEAGPRCWW